ncbi:MAG TPA: Sir2 family NAD+-dependent deacetylase [Alphaproteobacteria bacterium]|nr:Sir2 family NAD+-dependent deacetylase [Alphaproteobacteria bacterium]
MTELARDAAIVVLTGAGISKESGLDTFRDPDGIWARHRIEDVATPEAFARSPKRVYEFYNYRRRTLLNPEIRPNAAHTALARLEAEWLGQVLIVTQNVDDLHERAGSRSLIHMHGEHRKARCNACGRVAAHEGDLDERTVCSGCRKSGFMRPHVVWFGEIPLEMDRIQAALERASLFVSIGTSGQVYPAAGFVRLARAAGALTVELNLEPSAGASVFDESRYGPATEIVPAFVDSLLRARG